MGGLEEAALVLAVAALLVALVALRTARRRGRHDSMVESPAPPEPAAFSWERSSDTYSAPGEKVSVILVDLGPREIHVIKAVRNATGIGLGAAKELVESPPPVTVAEGLPLERAEALVAELEAAGATAEIG